MELLIFCRSQYELVRDSRKVLFEYCQTLSNADFTSTHSSFGRGGSIRNLIVHIANTYEFWIGQGFLKKEMVFTDYATITGMEDAVQLFNAVDHLMEEFFSAAENPGSDDIKTVIREENSLSAFKLFTHVITHEFHHKGQILSLSRQFGYVPVDTDIMR